jgi:DNA-binding transcriptional LysR family regulator
MDILRLRHILTVAQTRSFSRAAEQLNITQPALSRSIAAFEVRYGVRLFDRSRSGVMPTAIGRQIIDQARDLVGLASGMDRDLRLLARGEAGEVAIGFGPLMASLLLPDLGAYVQRTRPGLLLRTMIRTPDQLVQALMDDQIELIFGNSWPLADVQGLSVQMVGAIEVGLLVRSGHPLAGRTGLGRADLDPFAIASASDLVLAGLPDMTGAFICDNFHILRDLTLRSDAVWVGAPAAAQADIAAGALVILDLVDRPPIQSEIALVRRAGRSLSPAAIAVTDEARRLLTQAADRLS